MRWGTARGLCVALTCLVGCGLDGSDASLSTENAGPRAPGADFGDSEGGNAGVGAPGEPPPEKEIETEYEAPVATGRFVWVANPTSGRVALVDATTLAVRTVEAGNGPTFVGAVPGEGQDATVVLNVLSEDATLLRATANRIDAKTFPTAKNVNALAFSPDGRWAIAWADARKAPSAPRTEGFQELTVLDLTAGTATNLAVGYRPVLVGFAGAGRAYAVTRDGITIIGLGPNPARVKEVPIAEAPSDDPGTRDVFVTPDGTTAFVRRDGSAQIATVNLETNALGSVTLPGPVTDIDLSDGGDKAVAVVRQTSEVAVIPVASPAAFTTVAITGETVGSVALAPGGAKALLYTNATPTERFTILDIGGAPAFRTVRVYSPVLGIFSSPDARHAVVLHDRTEGTGSEPGTPGAFSIAPIADNLPPRIQATLARPTAVAVTNDRAIIAERHDSRGIFGAYLARMPQLMIERYPLASPPIAVGVVPAAKRAFIAQAHPEGRLTFIDIDTGVARTLTGFELSSRVVDGSRP